MKKIKREKFFIKKRLDAYETCKYCAGLKKNEYGLNCGELHDYWSLKKEKTACTHIFRSALSIVKLRRF